ncbi:RNA polymerase sigma-70 factor, ECF subfamily [Ectopseudomonas alcaliphila]|uniref:RNA polymerase sigma-70 factor, ECF subfamily n=1 Tax=Ectopseudomonas alcaliphila TaxID=101564 RepID=A0A1G6TGF7_9GAMM|nr:RNA polymerase sigma-70 factor, ECF subfamily [Pseudomonas alcaliphila]
MAPCPVVQSVDEQFRGTFSSVYRSVHAELTHFFRKRLESQADAADLAQDAFAQWLGWRDRNGVEQPRAFLFHIARNLLRDHWRRQQRQGQIEPLEVIADTAAVQPSPLERLDQQQRLRQLARVLEDLPPRRREALILHRFEGLSQNQVAARMGISLSMVEKHIAAALLHCKQQLARETGTDEQ